MAVAFLSLFGSTPAEFPSDYSLEESVERLRAVVKRFLFSTIFEEAAVGKVRKDRVSLQRYKPMSHNSFKPFFVGSFQERSGRVVLVGRFTMHILNKVYLGVWFGFLAVLGIVMAFAEVQVNRFLVLLVLFGFFLLGYGLTAFGQWLSRKDASWLAELIGRTLLREPDLVPLIPRAEQGKSAARASARPPGMTVLKILVAVSVPACLASAITGIASIHTGPNGDLVVTPHDAMGRFATALGAVVTSGFLYGLIKRIPMTWVFGWVLLVSGVLLSAGQGLARMLNNAFMINGPLWVLCTFWIVGATLVAIYWGMWWYKQRSYFYPPAATGTEELDKDRSRESI